jgi:ABC-type multidrug transport system fused ATPase/permease subunit
VKPLDRRLLRRARRAVVPIAVLAVLGLVSAALVIAQAWLLATMIANVFIDKATLAACVVPLAVLAAVTVGRAAAAWAAQAAAHRASAEAKTELRTALLARVLALGPGWRWASGDSADGGRRRDAAALTELATTGHRARRARRLLHQLPARAHRGRRGPGGGADHDHRR